MKILHTEASPGWGGQELRILNEARGMREKGHDIIMAIQEEGGLIKPAQEAGFHVYPLNFSKAASLKTFWQLLKLLKKEKIELLNTHSSLDAWIAGSAAKLLGIPIVRTRHLSTPIRKGWNSKLLYNFLADRVVTTCEEVVPIIQQQAALKPFRCLSIPTGIDPATLKVDPQAVLRFRESYGIKQDDVLSGTLCVLRGWKGVSDLLRAAKQSEHIPHLKWMVIGGGVSESYFLEERKQLGLEDRVIFTGHLSPPFTALAALDIFLLLSWAHEGVSQASLQAAYLEKPLVTTTTGGLKEVCLHEKTGFLVQPHAPHEVAEAVQRLVDSATLRSKLGQEGRQLVENRFLLCHTVIEMERIYNSLCKVR